MAHTPKELRRARIDSAQAEVDRLLGLVTQQPGKDALEKAVRNLKEAALWLASPDVDKRQSILKTVDFALESAARQIGIVRRGVARFRPEITILG